MLTLTQAGEEYLSLQQNGNYYNHFNVVLSMSHNNTRQNIITSLQHGLLRVDPETAGLYEETLSEINNLIELAILSGYVNEDGLSLESLTIT